MKDNKNLIIAILLAAVLVMSVGYAALSTSLQVGGTATIATNAKWDVEITGITVKSTTGNVTPGTPTFTATTATFNTTLAQPGDSATYEVTIENKGTIDATYSSVTRAIEAATGDNSVKGVIVYSDTEPGTAGSTVLAAGESKTATITVKFDDSATTVDAGTSRTATYTYQFVQASA
jgi:uncharacterized repeat protein (TIGR01451 family)